MAQWLTNLTRNHEVVGSVSLVLLSGLRIWRCRELWSQTWLGSHVAVAVVQASYSSDSTPSLGTSICRRCGPRKKKDKKQTNKNYHHFATLSEMRDSDKNHQWMLRALHIFNLMENWIFSWHHR